MRSILLLSRLLGKTSPLSLSLPSQLALPLPLPAQVIRVLFAFLLSAVLLLVHVLLLIPRSFRGAYWRLRRVVAHSLTSDIIDIISHDAHVQGVVQATIVHTRVEYLKKSL